MKIFLLVIYVLLALGALFAILGLAMGASMGIYWDSNGLHAGEPGSGDGSANLLREMDLAPFSNVSLNMVNHDIEFVPADHYGFELLNNNNKNTEVAWSLQNGRLTITEKSRYSFGVNLNFGKFKSGSYLKVYVPAQAIINDISVKSISGKISLSGFSCAALSIDTVSGRTDLADITTGMLVFDGISGRLSMHNIQTDSTRINVVSGSVVISNHKSGGLSLSSISGRVDVSGELKGNITINSTSGEVRLNVIGRSEQYSKQFNLLSGHLRINGQTMSRNYSERIDAPNSLKVDTISGGVTVDFVN